MLYRDEIWTGIEYQVAGHMAWEGMITEALAICRAVHERYHPAKHNPWNEIECGDHYARGMASWGVLTALSGFEYHGPKQHIGFAPRLHPHAFRSVFTAAQGWGNLDQQRSGDVQTNRIEVQWGELPITTLAFELPAGRKLRECRVTIGQQQVHVHDRPDGQPCRHHIGRTMPHRARRVDCGGAAGVMPVAMAGTASERPSDHHRLWWGTWQRHTA